MRYGCLTLLLENQILCFLVNNSKILVLQLVLHYLVHPDHVVHLLGGQLEVSEQGRDNALYEDVFLGIEQDKGLEGLNALVFGLGAIFLD